MRDIPRRDRSTIPAAEAMRLVHVDAEWRQPIEAVNYGCVTRCHSRDHVNRLAVAARFGHLMGISYTATEIGHWRDWADAAMGKVEPR